MVLVSCCRSYHKTCAAIKLTIPRHVMTDRCWWYGYSDRFCSERRTPIVPRETQPPRYCTVSTNRQLHLLAYHARTKVRDESPVARSLVCEDSSAYNGRHTHHQRSRSTAPSIDRSRRRSRTATSMAVEQRRVLSVRRIGDAIRCLSAHVLDGLSL
jgi:hypothetical protein